MCKTKIALYCRASDPNGIDTQIKELWENLSNDHIVYYDIGSSKNKRSAFEKLLEDANNHVFDEVRIVDMSRIDRKIENALSFLQKMKTLGIVVCIMAEPIFDSKTVHALKGGASLWQNEQ